MTSAPSTLGRTACRQFRASREMETKVETREEAKMDTNRGTDKEAGMEGKMAVGDTPARDAAQKARGRPFERGKRSFGWKADSSSWRLSSALRLYSGCSVR